LIQSHLLPLVDIWVTLNWMRRKLT
jgi:hypothetical protein